MKPKILKLSTVVLLLFFIGASCQKENYELADESIEITSIPSICIYKTKGDYRNKLALCLDSTGNITCTPLFNENSSVVEKHKNGNYKLKRRFFLNSGYVLELISLDRVFTNVTINEMVESFRKYDPGYWSHERWESRIIDRDPFAEFYRYYNNGKPPITLTIKEINEMLINGTIEEQFTKMK
ncbi:MAG: hypothetical protein HN778_07640 [Prolixibacteraceae bacterium]|nr:hypothetical protein [Prolixibacteraceae bacterium]MBT6767148.1 hypothetical protein [Prolixibacteraceae bacterium]MBT6999733.1 hypothetical protein [Prolixibacteraceae bacterium]MBT7394689.1 hypothetical protein [Prolixibacteraceae bacterium]